jgi:hypothetical protein
VVDVTDEEKELRTLDQASYGPEGWLEPVQTPHTNVVMHAPPGHEDEVGDLHVELVSHEGRYLATVATFDLTDEQRLRVASGARIQLHLLQHPMPPVGLQVEPPYCEKDGTLMVFVKAAGEYACPSCDPRFPNVQNGSGKIHVVGEVQQDEDDRGASRRALDAAHGDFTPEDDSPPAA